MKKHREVGLSVMHYHVIGDVFWRASLAAAPGLRWCGYNPALAACSACAGLLYLFVSRANTGTRPKAVLGL